MDLVGNKMKKIDFSKINIPLSGSNYPSVTNHELFNRDDYIFIKNFHDVSSLVEPVPQQRGSTTYYGSLDNFYHEETEVQVNGSYARYSYPPYKRAYYDIKEKLEKVLGKELYTTYYYDRFYFAGQELTPHQDRNGCEISVTLHISTNSHRKTWPFYVRTPYQEIHSVTFSPGDAVVYRGCDAIHWREELPSRYNRTQNAIRTLMRKHDDTYYHQVFFHYVLANGYRLFAANDSSR